MNKLYKGLLFYLYAMRDILRPGLNPWASTKTLKKEVEKGYVAEKLLFKASASSEAWGCNVYGNRKFLRHWRHKDAVV